MISLSYLLIFSYLTRSNKDIFFIHNDTSSTYGQEVHFYLHVLESLRERKNGDQALALFQRDLDMPLGESCIILEEAQDNTTY